MFDSHARPVAAQGSVAADGLQAAPTVSPPLDELVAPLVVPPLEVVPEVVPVVAAAPEEVDAAPVVEDALVVEPLVPVLLVVPEGEDELQAARIRADNTRLTQRMGGPFERSATTKAHSYWS